MSFCPNWATNQSAVAPISSGILGSTLLRRKGAETVKRDNGTSERRRQEGGKEGRREGGKEGEREGEKKEEKGKEGGKGPRIMKEQTNHLRMA